MTHQIELTDEEIDFIVFCIIQRKGELDRRVAKIESTDLIPHASIQKEINDGVIVMRAMAADLLSRLRADTSPGKTPRDNEMFGRGYYVALQNLVAVFDQPSMASCLLRDSGIPRKEAEAIQKATGYMGDLMKAVLFDAYREKA